MGSRLKKVAVTLAALVVGLFLGLCVLGFAYEPSTQVPPGALGRSINVRGTPLRVYQGGSGRDVLLIHGSPGSVEDWKPVIDALGTEVHVTAYDRPGNGYSSDTTDYSIEKNADVALALVHQLGLQRVVVVGHSYGGATALRMALRDDASVSSYVIVDTAAYSPSRSPDITLRAIAVPLAGFGLATVVSPWVAPSKIRAGLIDQFLPGHPPPEPFLEQRMAMWSTPKISHSIAAETLGARGWLEAQSAHYPEIKKPVFILGEADKESRRKSAEQLHADIAGSSLELLHDTGHYIQFEKTAEVVATIRRAALLP